jgi:hypothetical protein
VAHYKGVLAEILLEAYQNATARLYCPTEAVPRAGQYLQVWSPADELKVVPASVFLSGKVTMQRNEIAIPIDAPLPESWQPGTELQLRGPLGRGFELPKRAKRVVLAALAGSPGRLLPIAAQALDQGAQVVLCTKGQASDTSPLEIEVRALGEVNGLLGWADYLAIDVRLEEMEGLGQVFGESRLPRALTAEALVLSPMPCGGLAQCGVCAVETSAGQLHLCENGPVIDLNLLL